MQTLARAAYSRPNDTESDAFVCTIQRDPDICNNCFRLTHVTYERNYAVDSYCEDGESKVWFREVDLPPRSWPRPDETAYMPGENSADGTYLTCQCGSKHDSIRPVSKETAMVYVERILERLEEKNIDVDKTGARMIAHRLLSDPAWQGRQDDVFGRVVEAAIDETPNSD